MLQSVECDRMILVSSETSVIFSFHRKRQTRATDPTRSLHADTELHSFKIVADIAGKEYADENDRTKVLDAKAGPLIGATGAGITFLVGTIVRPPDGLSAARG